MLTWASVAVYFVALFGAVWAGTTRHYAVCGAAVLVAVVVLAGLAMRLVLTL